MVLNCGLNGVIIKESRQLAIARKSQAPGIWDREYLQMTTSLDTGIYLTPKWWRQAWFCCWSLFKDPESRPVLNFIIYCFIVYLFHLPRVSSTLMATTEPKRKLPLCTYFREGRCRGDCKFTHVSCRDGVNCKNENCVFGHDNNHIHLKKKLKSQRTPVSPSKSPPASITKTQPRPSAARRARIRKRLATRDAARKLKLIAPQSDPTVTVPSGTGPPEIVAQTTDPPVIAPHGADPPVAAPSGAGPPVIFFGA